MVDGGGTGSGEHERVANPRHTPIEGMVSTRGTVFATPDSGTKGSLLGLAVARVCQVAAS